MMTTHHSENHLVYGQYRDPWNEVRIGKLLEDLDALAGTISVKHCSDEDSMTRPLLLVTASVDKMVLKKTISVDGDLKMGGSVVWVGRSSIEVQLEVTQLSIDSTVITETVALSANFIFVARDSKTGKAAPVNRLSPQTETEKSLYKEADARNVMRKLKKGEKKGIENGEQNRLDSLLAEGLMPYFLEVDHVDFLRPVDVGDFLRFKSCVLYTEFEHAEKPLINVEVVAHVTRPELRSSEVSNTFYFTFTVRPEAKANDDKFRIRKVVPATEEEARRILERMDAESLLLK
ncbi:unnamed protein product [Lactuca virosa]|uniref:HotDog ACOT-type domain-containing protein n=1 Tax=Lactuca virosa TaxID=75947 RepID=A0AAU9LZX3_9ASTR|nr:unnamed protein product [Lactuca virosa]